MPAKCIPGKFLTHYGSNTDIEWINSSSVSARGDLSRYVNSSTNTDMNTTNTATSNAGNAWEWMYIGIERANLLHQRNQRFWKSRLPVTKWVSY